MSKSSSHIRITRKVSTKDKVAMAALLELTRVAYWASCYETLPPEGQAMIQIMIKMVEQFRN